MIEKVCGNHLDSVEITDESSENLYCKKAFIDNDQSDGPCPEPQELDAVDNVKYRTLTITISYVLDKEG